MTDTRSPCPATPVTTLAGSRLAKRGQLGSFKKRDVLLRQEQDGALLIRRGVVKVSALIRGRDTMLGIRTAGDLVGEELAILAPSPHEHGLIRRKATALTDVSAILIPVEELRDYLGEHPADLLTVTRNLCMRLAEAEERPVARNVAKSRLAHVLCQLHDLHTDAKRQARGAELPVQLTQADLASWIGACRESVDKALREFDRRGIISRHNGKIAIQDPGVLARIGGSGA